MKQICFFLLFILSPGLFSCRENKARTEAEQIVKEWTGKQIRFPDEFSCNFLGKDTVANLCSGLLTKEYKILLYVDSTGCTSCKLQLIAWKGLIEESRDLHDRLSFLLFFNPKNRDKKELSFLLRRDKLDYPVFMDMDNNIQELNHFPDQSNYQCFLLDKNNRVLMIGNPVSTPKIWELFKQQVTGIQTQPRQNLTSAEIEKPHHDFGEIPLNEENEVVFELKNTGQNPLLIFRVNASCGCTSVDWNKDPVNPGQTTNITVTMKPDEAGYFNKTVDVHGNMENSPVRLRVSGTGKMKDKN